MTLSIVEGPRTLFHSLRAVNIYFLVFASGHYKLKKNYIHCAGTYRVLHLMARVDNTQAAYPFTF